MNHTVHPECAGRSTATSADTPPSALSWDPLLAMLGHGQWLWEPQAQRWHLSPTCAGLLGYGDAEITLDADGWQASIHPDDRARAAACMQNPDAAGGTWQYDFRRVPREGGERRVLVRGVTVEQDGAGLVRRVLGTCTETNAVGNSGGVELARDQRLSAALEQAQIAWFERDLTTNIGIGSPALATIYGLPNPIGPWHFDEIRACVVPEDLPGHTREVEQALALRVSDQTTRIKHYRIRRPDGELRHIEVRYRNLYEGELACAFGLVFDVTETKALESKFQDAMEHTNMAWFERDLVTDKMSGSRSMWRIYGLNPHKPLYFRDILARIQSAGPYVHPANTDDLRRQSRALHGVATEIDTAVVVYPVLTDSADLRWIEARYRIRLDGFGGGTVSGLVVDITATERAESAALDGIMRLRIALEAARMASWEWDFATGRVSSSDGFGALHALAGDGSWPVETVYAAIHADDVAAVRDDVAAAYTLGSDHPLQREHRIPLADGGERWVEVFGRRKGQAMFGVLADITSRKLAELERERLHRQLQQAQKMESIGLLTGGLAHDFNNILASVLGYSGLALQRFADRIPEKLIDYLKEIQTAGGRARDLVAQMLAFSRGENSELVSQDIGLVLAETFKMMRPTLPASIGIRISGDSDLPAVLIDPVQLQQVVLNLTINARDALAGNGHIELSLHRRQVEHGDCASCHHQFSGEFIVLGVADDGPGIAEATAARIFEPFFSTKAPGHGTGMGLAMVHGIVHRHQGHLLLRTAPNAGCAFEILLPLAPDAGQASAKHEVIDLTSYEASGPLNVLVVDDERAVASFVGELLELNGYTVTVETDATRAWELFAANPQRFDLLVTDQTMPRLTGAELAARMMAVRNDLPVVLITGYSVAIDARKAHTLGIRAYLHKPVRGDELLAAIAKALEQPTAA